MTAIVKLQSLSKSFSPAEKRVADYIARHADGIPLLSVQAIARAVGVNAASVCRMSQHAGFVSFRELKIALARETASSISAIHQAIAPGDSDERIIQKTFGGNIQSLEDTLRALDSRDLVRAAKAVSDATRVVFFGVGSSGCVAQDAALRLAHLQVRSEACIDSYQMLVLASQLTKGQVAVGISHSGRSTVTVQALRVAQQGGTTTIGISNYLRSPLQKASAIFFCTAFRDTNFKATSLSASVAQMCLIDSLYLLVARHRPMGGKTEKINQTVERLGRIPEGRK
jgi:DNA-binding MurR/RpiR family transcriptional regulator